MKSTQTLVNFVMLCIFCCLAGMLSSCAGVAYVDVANRIPPLQAGYARVYLYSVNQSWERPVFDVSINGERVGKVQPYQVLFVDRPAGSINVTAKAVLIWPTPHNEIMLTLVAGETRYIQVELEPHLGHLRFILMDPNQAVPDLNECYYVGPSLTGIPKE